MRRAWAAVSRAARAARRRARRRAWWVWRGARGEGACGRGRGVVVVGFGFVGAGRGSGGGGEEVGTVVGWASGWGGGSLVGGEEAAAAGGIDFEGVLKGDLKGWERVFVAVLRRRRFEGWTGDMIGGGGSILCCNRDCYELSVMVGNSLSNSDSLSGVPYSQPYTRSSLRGLIIS